MCYKRVLKIRNGKFYIELIVYWERRLVVDPEKYGSSRIIYYRVLENSLCRFRKSVTKVL